MMVEDNLREANDEDLPVAAEGRPRKKGEFFGKIFFSEMQRHPRGGPQEAPLWVGEQRKR
jgi:hypothetical protein